MRITVDIPEEAFLRTKTAEEIAKEAREAAILYWVVRGEMDSARIVQFAQPGQAERLWNALDSMPDVGSDEDFARSRDFGRSPPFGEAEAG